MAIYKNTPPIVINGLVLALDAANPKSYVSGSTVWRDLTNPLVSGSLVNGPTYNTSNGGSIVFDGVNDYASTDHNSLLNLTETFTISTWIYPSRTNTQGYIINKNNSYAIIIGYQQGFVNFYNRAYQPSSTATQIPINVNEWVNITYSKNSNALLNNWNGYKNGIPIFSLTTSFTNTTNTNILSLSTSNGTGDFYQGRISTIQLYNRALSAQEVLQNYNATKGRFGL